MKTIRDMLLGALLAASVGAAMALTGTPPGTGPALQDGTWLNGLANGDNYSYQSGITAAGTTQATATQLPATITLIQIDTAAASTGVNLPPCLAGRQMQVFNNGANAVLLYPAVANNPVTAAQDTINGTTSFSLASKTSTSPMCAKNGTWGAG